MYFLGSYAPLYWPGRPFDVTGGGGAAQVLADISNWINIAKIRWFTFCTIHASPILELGTGRSGPIVELKQQTPLHPRRRVHIRHWGSRPSAVIQQPVPARLDEPESPQKGCKHEKHDRHDGPRPHVPAWTHGRLKANRRAWERRISCNKSGSLKGSHCVWKRMLAGRQFSMIPQQQVRRHFGHCITERDDKGKQREGGRHYYEVPVKMPVKIQFNTPGA
ncbi:hypothetical protein DFH09DRAFT_1094133 [Mycena vulgaris]|nr:hypothetical protein DFH09DRAFT_1094133 [Mycena vulgaris]